MPTTRPFAYNTGSTIVGTIQIGDLAIGVDPLNYAGGVGGVQWWGGPDEDLGYVIAHTVPSGTQPTQVPDDAITLSTTYKGVDISVTNNNQTAAQLFGYQQSVLGETIISGTNKVMFSVLCNLLEPSTLIGSHVIGVGTTSMNYQGNPYGGYPGNDIYSIGFSDDGNYYYNGSSVQSGLPTWTDDDIIDIAISAGQYWWIRVNGGNWNNNPSANPTTLANGSALSLLTNFYPALCPYIYGTMEILNYPKYGVPTDYDFLGNVSASVGFFRSSALTDPSFISLSNSVAAQSGGGPFASGSAAKTWLNSNGYWTSFGGGGGTGDFNVTITQVGNDVVWSGSGSFNLTALTSAGPGSIVGGYNSGQAVWAIGPNTSVDTYSGTITYPLTFGTSAVGVTSNAGSTFGILPGGSARSLYVPSGYVSNTNISGTATYINTTIASAGLTPGTYTWSWGTGGNTSTLVMTISS